MCGGIDEDVSGVDEIVFIFKRKEAVGMGMIGDYRQYSFTKIEANIYLEECPSDIKTCAYSIDVDVDAYTQEFCCIDNQWIEHLCIQRNQGTEECKISWKITFFVGGAVSRAASIELLSSYCVILSRKLALNLSYHCHGLVDFRVDPVSVHCFYSLDGKTYSDFERSIVVVGRSEMRNRCSENIFALSCQRDKPDPDPLHDKFLNSYMEALRSRDVVSRYILLYYLLEIIYKTDRWTQYSEDAKASDKDNWRSMALKEYFLNEFGIQEYYSFGKVYSLLPDIFKKIIEARNKLVHEANQSKLQDILYCHFIPILQAMLKLWYAA